MNVFLAPRSRRQFIGGSTLLCASALTACGKGEAGPPASPTAVPPTSTPWPTPTPTMTMEEEFPARATWKLRNQAGYSYDMTIALADKVRVPTDQPLTHRLDRDLVLGTGCVAEPQFDIVIPGYMSAKATTVGFDTVVRMRAGFSASGYSANSREYSGRGVPPSSDDYRIQVEQNFSSGPNCEGFATRGDNTGFGVQWETPASSGTVLTSEFFIIVKDYFSPATPNGDYWLLDWIVISPQSGGDYDDQSSLFTLVNSGDYMPALTLTGRTVYV